MLDSITFTPEEALPALRKAIPNNVRCMVPILERVSFTYNDVDELVYNALYDKDLKTLQYFNDFVELPRTIKVLLKMLKWLFKAP